jgi:hypothetical protein
MKFPNGFECWHETHYQMVTTINANEDVCTDPNTGTGGLWMLARDWTNEFEKLFKGVEWGMDDSHPEWFEAIDQFTDEKISKLNE